MKKITSALAIIALAFTLSTMTFGQNGKRTQRGIQGGITRGRQAQGTPTGSVTFGKVKASQAQGNQLVGNSGRDWFAKAPRRSLEGNPDRPIVGVRQGASRKEFDKGYLSPNAARGYRGTTTVNQGLRKTDVLSGGSGNDAARAAKAGFLTTEPQGPTYTSARRNSAGSSEQTNSSYSKYELKDVLVSSYSNPKSNLLATTYGRGYRGTTTVNKGSNNLTVNGGAGNDTLSSARIQSRTANPNRVAGDWDGDGTTTVGRRRNFGHFAGPLDHAQINSGSGSNTNRMGLIIPGPHYSRTSRGKN